MTDWIIDHFLWVVGISIVLLFAGAWAYESHNPCIKSHQEIQYKPPMQVVSGGISIPLGNVEPVSVTVCDLRQKDDQKGAAK